MKKQIYQLIVVLLVLAIPILAPQRAEARNWRLYYDNKAYNYKQQSGSSCVGTLACLTEANIKTSPLSVTAVGIGCTGAGCFIGSSTFVYSQTGNIPGYYLGTYTNANLPGGVGYAFFPVAVAPSGGGNPAGGGGGGGPPPAPITAGVVGVRARQLASPPSACSDVYASSTYVPVTVSVSPQGVPANAQPSSGGNYASWGVLPGTETVTSVPPANYILKMACWQGTNPSTSGTGLSAAVAGGQTIAWDLGYTFGTSWPQVSGGDAYAFTNIASYVPATAAPRRFVLDGTGGKPGIVTYGNSSDFDADIAGSGTNYVSSTNWLAKDQNPRTDFYQAMYRRFGAPTTVNYDHPTNPITQATSSATPYYAVGDITTSGNWLVGDGETLIFLVNGNLTIGGKIQTTGTGFVAFIVNGNITVSPSVGVAFNSTTPAVMGVYITSPNGVFATGNSSVAGAERFVGKGMFVAGDFRNERDLGASNTTYAAELYQYDPQILITMPELMKDTNALWREVAP